MMTHPEIDWRTSDKTKKSPGRCLGLTKGWKHYFSIMIFLVEILFPILILTKYNPDGIFTN